MAELTLGANCRVWCGIALAMSTRMRWLSAAALLRSWILVRSTSIVEWRRSPVMCSGGWRRLDAAWYGRALTPPILMKGRRPSNSALAPFFRPARTLLGGYSTACGALGAARASVSVVARGMGYRNVTRLLGGQAILACLVSTQRPGNQADRAGSLVGVGMSLC